MNQQALQAVWRVCCDDASGTWRLAGELASMLRLSQAGAIVTDGLR